MLTPEQLAILHEKRGSKSGRKTTSLPDETVTSIRKAYWIESCTLKELAERMNLSKTAISAIVHGRTYKDVPFPTEWFESSSQ